MSGMLSNTLAVLGSAALGYVLFWAVSWRRGPASSGPPLLGFKYLGFKSYSEMKGYLIGKNFLWGPIVGVGGTVLLAQLGLSEAFWVLSFWLGYGLAIWRFLAKPKKHWDAENLPVWRA